MDVCVLGRIGYDLYALEHGRPLGEVERFSRHLGGSSANIAVGLARLGHDVGIISSLGADALADYLLAFLKTEKVDTRFVRLVPGYNTSLCLTEVSPPDRFPQVFYRREPADTRVEVGPPELDAVRSARLFVTNGTSLAASPSREATLAALRTAREARARTVLDVDYRASSWRSPAAAGEQARRALPFVDVVLGNEDEITLLTGEADPHRQVAAVLDAGLPVELVPLDVTRRVVLAQGALTERLLRCSDRVARFILDFTLHGFAFGEEREGGGIVLHDPLAMAVALDPSLVTFEALHVEVECEGKLTRGLSLADRRAIPSHRKRASTCRVAMDVDAERVLGMVLERLCPVSA